MNHPVPGYLLAYVLGGTAAIIAALLSGTHRALKAANWQARDRRRAVGGAAALLLTWYFAALIPSRLGFYRGAPSRIPTIQYGLLIPILAGVALFWRWPGFKRVVEAVPQPWMVSVQLYRVLGLIFFVLLAGGRMPGVFAWPAGVGDVIVGLLAPVVGFAYARRWRHAAGLVRAWNLFGIADLIVAVGTGFLSSPSPLQVWALGAGNTLIGAFPLVMIPVFLVPLSILLHLASLKKLRQSEATRQVPRPTLARERG